MTDFNEKPILAFDCSTTSASVALMLGERLATRTLVQGQQAALLVPAIEEVMAELGARYADLHCLVTTLGPGSFTGLRIALATLHGLALAHALPVRATTALQAAAYDITAPSFTLALNAGKGELFYQRFTKHAPVGDIELSTPEPLLAQDDCFSNMLPPEHPRYTPGPQAATLCRMAASIPLMPLAEAMPFYIRPPDAKLPSKPAWLQTT